MAYLLDASVFIEAKRRHYGLDFCPAFWDWLIDASEKKLILSIEKVLDELIEGGDELVEWSVRLGKEFFAAPDQGTILSLAAAMEWVRRQQFKQAAE
jgi:hypothetical protein